MNESADFVMYWWDRSAEIVAAKDAKTRRFGFVTTNSITQVFSRRVIERHMVGLPPINLTMAIADHPWTKVTSSSAAVRIAMTVAETGSTSGLVFTVESEDGLDTDQPQIDLKPIRGRINPDLTVGADTVNSIELAANQGVSNNGMLLAGRGFVLTADAAKNILDREPRASDVVKPYRGGSDLITARASRSAIDCFDLPQEEVRTRYPVVYEHLLATVKPVRETNNRATYRDRWWIFAEPRRNFRPALVGLPRYVATTETTKHRYFQFLDASIVPDHMVVAVASSDPLVLGVLSARAHVVWSVRSGGWLGVGNDARYSKSRCFDPFPFPTPDRETANEIRAIAEELDKHRKDRQAEHPGLTLTDMYNVLEKLRGGVALDDDDRRIKDQRLVLMLKEYHDRLDAAVARAYGWPVDLTDEQILERLVALNAERAEEEKNGRVRWLRPDYQIPRFGSASEKARWQREQAGERPEADDVHPTQGEMQMAGGASGITASTEDDATKPKFPTNDEMAETAAVMTALLASSKPMTPTEVARHFKGGTRNERRVRLVLDALSRLGHLSSADGGASYALRRGG